MKHHTLDFRTAVGLLWSGLFCSVLFRSVLLCSALLCSVLPWLVGLVGLSVCLSVWQAPLLCVHVLSDNAAPAAIHSSSSSSSTASSSASSSSLSSSVSLSSSSARRRRGSSSRSTKQQQQHDDEVLLQRVLDAVLAILLAAHAQDFGELCEEIEQALVRTQRRNPAAVERFLKRVLTKPKLPVLLLPPHVVVPATARATTTTSTVTSTSTSTSSTTAVQPAQSQSQFQPHTGAETSSYRQVRPFSQYSTVQYSTSRQSNCSVSQSVQDVLCSLHSLSLTPTHTSHSHCFALILSFPLSHSRPFLPQRKKQKKKNRSKRRGRRRRTLKSSMLSLLSHLLFFFALHLLFSLSFLLFLLGLFLCVCAPEWINR